jgi:hypothetical protein
MNFKKENVGKVNTRVILTNEFNTTFFLFDELLKGSKSLKMFKIILTFRSDKW